MRTFRVLLLALFVMVAPLTTLIYLDRAAYSQEMCHYCWMIGGGMYCIEYPC